LALKSAKYFNWNGPLFPGRARSIFLFLLARWLLIWPLGPKSRVLRDGEGRTSGPMTDSISAELSPPLVKGVVTLRLPHETDFLDVLRLWQSKRGARSMPSRLDFEPSEFAALLPDIFLVDVAPTPPRYRFRLMGEQVVRFHGCNFTGKTFEQCFEPRAATLLVALFDTVVEGHAPIFRAGTAYWWTEKTYRKFESCYFPLSADGHTANMVLGAVRFPRLH
jgi:hypothetical protein